MTAARQPDSDSVAARAYSIWEEEGRPHGRDRAHWERAEQELAPADATSTGDVPSEMTPAPAPKKTRARKSPAAGDVAPKPTRARKAAAAVEPDGDAAAPIASEPVPAPKRGRAKPGAS